MVIDMYICRRPLRLQMHSITITASSCGRSLVYMYMNIQTDIVIHGHGHTYIYVHIHIHIHIHVYTVHMDIYIYIRTCMCMCVYVFIFSAVIHPSEFHRNIFTICFIHAGIRPRSLIRPPRQPDYRTRSVCVRARDACDPNPPFRSLDTWTCDPWMFKFHDCLRSMHARKTRGGADSQHAKGPCYREGDSGRLFIFQPYYSKRGFGLCRKISPPWVR